MHSLNNPLVMIIIDYEIKNYREVFHKKVDRCFRFMNNIYAQPKIVVYPFIYRAIDAISI